MLLLIYLGLWHGCHLLYTVSGPNNEMVNVSYQEEYWYVLLQNFDKNSALDKTYFYVTEVL